MKFNVFKTLLLGVFCCMASYAQINIQPEIVCTMDMDYCNPGSCSFNKELCCKVPKTDFGDPNNPMCKNAAPAAIQVQPSCTMDMNYCNSSSCNFNAELCCKVPKTDFGDPNNSMCKQTSLDEYKGFPVDCGTPNEREWQVPFLHKKIRPGCL